MEEAQAEEDVKPQSSSRGSSANLVLDLSDQRSDDDHRSCKDSEEDSNSDYLLQR